MGIDNLKQRSFAQINNLVISLWSPSCPAFHAGKKIQPW